MREQRKGTILPKDELDLLIAQGVKVSEIAKKYGITKQAVYQRIRPYPYKKKGGKLLRNARKILRLLNEGKSTVVVAETVGCHYLSVHKFVKKHVETEYYLREDSFEEWQEDIINESSSL